VTSRHYVTGPGKAAVYARIMLAIPFRYARRARAFRRPAGYVRFLARALRLLLVFRHNKIVRTARGFKLHLYLPAYPSPAFFHALDSKLLRAPPGPTTVVFSMTRACDYRCRHCYQRRDGGADVEEERLLRTARAVRDAGVAFFNIEGGEPFLRFDRLLHLVQALDERCEIWINSTGAHATPERLAALQSAGAFGMIVSIHAPDADRHDAFTGVPGSFETAVRLLRRWKALGGATALNSVLAEADLRRGGLDELMAVAGSLDADYVQLIHPKPAGGWMGRTEGMQTEAGLLDFVRREHLRYNGRGRHNDAALAAQVFEESADVLGCTAGGVDRFYVNAEGAVQPCEFLNLSFGNVNEEPFERIFERMRSCFPVPGTDWLCCTQAAEIHRLFEAHRLQKTPLPWPVTRDLVARWECGPATPLYERLGIYRKRP
jgi:MoaA/NifB/PqqE/SkfB family radical SAM enzyme